MLSFITIFFFVIYLLCEMVKFKKVETLLSKDKNRVYNKPVVFVKLVALIITCVLLIIHRFTDEGVIDRTNNLKTSMIYLCVFCLLIFISIVDIKKAKKD